MKLLCLNMIKVCLLILISSPLLRAQEFDTFRTSQINGLIKLQSSTQNAIQEINEILILDLLNPNSLASQPHIIDELYRCGGQVDQCGADPVPTPRVCSPLPGCLIRNSAPGQVLTPQIIELNRNGIRNLGYDLIFQVENIGDQAEKIEVNAWNLKTSQPIQQSQLSDFGLTELINAAGKCKGVFSIYSDPVSGPSIKMCGGIKTPKPCSPPSACIPRFDEKTGHVISKIKVLMPNAIAAMHLPDKQVAVQAEQLTDKTHHQNEITVAQSHEHLNDAEQFGVTPTKAFLVETMSIMNKYVPNWYHSTIALQNSSGSVYCSGVVISPEHILTAAHCLCERELPTYAFFGSSIFDTPDSADEKAARISIPFEDFQAMYKPDFCARFSKFISDPENEHYPEGDLAVLKLAAEIPPQIEELIFPLETIAHGRPGSFIYSAGYGLSDNAAVSGTKHRGDFVFQSRLCSVSDQKTTGCHEGQENITISRDLSRGTDSCFGDSGSPVFIRNTADDRPNVDGEFTDAPRLIAITSRGLPSNQEGYCGRGAINISLEPQAVRDWLLTFRSK